MSRAFSLVELLVVVAIIAILAAIAMVNYMGAQGRSKVSRAKCDMRTISAALEAYAVDFSEYPYPLRKPGSSMLGLEYVTELTTPVAYLQTVQLLDPFKPDWKQFYDNKPSVSFAGGYSYCNWGGRFGEHSARMPGVSTFPCYVLSSVGPDRDADHIFWLAEWLQMRRDDADTVATGFAMVYDPTNGTSSSGDIGRFGGESNIGNLN